MKNIINLNSVKRFVGLFVCILVAAIWLNSNTVMADEIVDIEFSDINMFNKVLEQLQGTSAEKKQGADKTISINKTDLENVETLNLNNSNIVNIRGVQRFINLKVLNLSNNNIEDIKLVYGLTNLTNLNVSGNRISSLYDENSGKGLNNLTNLTTLNLSKNKFVDIANGADVSVSTKISTLTNLKNVDISHNHIRYTNGLSNLTELESLNLYDNNVIDLDGIKELVNLKYLNLGANNEDGSTNNGNGIKNRTNIQYLVNLEVLDFSNNKTSDILKYIRPEMTQLKSVNVEGNNIESGNYAFRQLKNVKGTLKVLNLYNNNITSVEDLLELTSLEELVLQKNNITDISGVVDTNNQNNLVWSNIKKLDIARNSIDMSNNDNVHAITILQNLSNSKSIELNYEDIVDTTNLLANKNYVTYEEFGARCDGVYDDFISIRNAHQFANKNNCEVKATAGKTYHIFKFYEDAVRVQTNVDWTGAKFVIHDENIEEYTGKYKSIFKVSNIDDSKVYSIDNPNFVIDKNTKNISNLSNDIKSKLNELSEDYDRFLCSVYNDQKNQYIRYGTNATSGNIQQDYFVIDTSGNVLNDIQWDFANVSSIVISPIPKTTLIIKGGEFVTNAIENMSETTYTVVTSGKGKYIIRNIDINNSGNVEVSGITHKLSYAEGEDELSGSYKGFIACNNSCDVKIKDCNLFTRKYSISGRSTYDLVLDSSVNIECSNIKSNGIDDVNRWGIVGTYYSKDVTFNDDCVLNRIDSHEGIYNLTIDNCTIGVKGLTLAGMGTLNLTNSTIQSNSVITLRDDYGSTWDGDVNISNCVHKYAGTSNAALITVTPYGAEHDFGYDCKLPNISVENYAIDMQNSSDADNYYDVFYIKETGSNIESSYMKNYLPNDIFINKFEIKNASNNDEKIEVSNLNLISNSYTPDNYNYVISNLDIKEDNQNGNDIAKDMLSYDDYTTDKNVYIKIEENSSSKNYIRITKDGNDYVQNTQVSGIYTNTITQAGEYEVILSSSENKEELAGERIYKFTKGSTEPEITEIKIEKLPDQVDYIQNYSNLNLDGGILKIKYNDETEESIVLNDNDVTVTGFDNSTVGTNTLTVNYKGFSTTFDVNIISKQIISIEIDTLPTKTQYIQNYEEFSAEGGKILVKYSDETSSKIELGNENVTITGFDNTKVGKNTLTVSYLGNITTFDVDIISKQIIEIEMDTLPTKTKYVQNSEELDLTGAKILVKYSDNSSDMIELKNNNNITIEGFDNSTLGKNTITVIYSGNNTTFNVDIIQKEVVNIEIEKLPKKLVYIENFENLDLTDGILNVIYNDRTTSSISLDNSSVKVTGFDNSVIGTNTLIVEYFNKTTTFDISIISKQITGIEINSLPSKQEYIQNFENLVLDGGTIKVKYNNNTTDVISMKNENVHISGFNNKNVGLNTINVEYLGKTTTFDVNIIQKQISRIYLSDMPTKIDYIQNYESLEKDGGYITVIYNDESDEKISLTNENVKVTGFDNSVVGTNTLTVEYLGKTTNFDVNIVSKQVLEIEIDTLPLQINYIQNYENLVLDGGYINVKYNDNTNSRISMTNENVKVTRFDNSVVGINTLTVEYLGLTTNFDVNIVSKQITGISIDELPTKREYIQNYEELALDGGVIKVAYNDKSTDKVSMTNENINVTGFNNTNVGKNTLTISYLGNTTTFDVDIISKQVIGISIEELPTKTEYIQNYEELELDGGVIKILYSDRSTDNVSMTNENVKVTEFDNSKVGKNTLTVNYLGKITTFDVNIVSKKISEIEIETLPTKTEYIQNFENIDLAGGSIKIKYNDNTTSTLALINENVVVTGFDNTNIGKNTLTVEYLGHQTTFDVDIISKQLTGIEINTKPIKNSYIEGYENLDLTGGILTLKYNDNTVSTISMESEDVKVTGFNNNIVGKNTLTVGYLGKTATFDVDIVSKQISNIEIESLPTKLKYIQNKEMLDLAGGKIEVIYNNNTTDVVSMDNENVGVTGFDNTKVGKNQIVLVYNSKSLTFDVEIISKEVVSVEIEEMPINTKYMQNIDTLDLTGGIIKVTYNDNTADEIEMTNDNVKVSGYDNSSVGRKTIALEYFGKITTLDVEIIPKKNVRKIEITNKPLKEKYIQNYENLDLTGGILKVTFEDDTTREMNLKNSKITTSGFDNTLIGKNTIQVEYDGIKTTFDVDIISKQIVSVELGKLPLKTKYENRIDNLDLTGGYLIIKYNDNTEDKISLTNENIKVLEFDNTKVGDQTIIIEYNGHVIKFDIEITENISNQDKEKQNENNSKEKIKEPNTGTAAPFIMFILLISSIVFARSQLYINKRNIIKSRRKQ